MEERAPGGARRAPRRGVCAGRWVRPGSSPGDGHPAAAGAWRGLCGRQRGTFYHGPSARGGGLSQRESSDESGGRKTLFPLRAARPWPGSPHRWPRRRSGWSLALWVRMSLLAAGCRAARAAAVPPHPARFHEAPSGGAAGEGGGAAAAGPGRGAGPGPWRRQRRPPPPRAAEPRSAAATTASACSAGSPAGRSRARRCCPARWVRGPAAEPPRPRLSSLPEARVAGRAGGGGGSQRALNRGANPGRACGCGRSRAGGRAPLRGAAGGQGPGRARGAAGRGPGGRVQPRVPVGHPLSVGLPARESLVKVWVGSG